MWKKPRRRWLGPAICGLLGAAAGVAVGELLAAVTRPVASPLVAVGGTVIDATPTPLKEFAVRTVGTNDKPLLLSGIVVALCVFAALIGVLAARRAIWGMVGFGLFGAIGVFAALLRPASSIIDVFPSLLAAVVGLGVMSFLLRQLTRAPRATPGSPSTAIPRQAEETTATAATPHDAMSPHTPDNHDDAPPPGPSAPEPSRRQFLLTTAAVVGATALVGAGSVAVKSARGSSAARAREAIRLPVPADAARPLPSGTAPGFYTPNADFYRVDTALTVPNLDVDSWRLTIKGMVDRPMELSFADLLRRELVERDITLNCVSNEVGGPYIGTARWIGVPLSSLLREAGVQSGANQVVSRSTEGMTIGTPVDTIMDGRDAMLVLGMNGEPLPLEHGFPVRMLTPGLFGYVGACKWLTELELSTFDAYDTYWVQRGWAAQAPVKTASRIDRPAPFATLTAGQVTVAGVAWAQRRGIAAVEVQIDQTPWRMATLLPVPSTDTWVQWTFAWTATPGAHTIRVRATDATGATQTEERATPFPNGATGWPSTAVTVS